MRGCLRYAFTNGHIKINIGESLKADIPVTVEKQILPRELEDTFVNLFPEEYQQHVIGLIYTGTRISEFMDLNSNWETDIDYKNKIVKIRETKSLRQKDIKAGITYIIREIPLLDPIAQIKFPLKVVKNQTINKNFNKVLKKMNAEDKNLNLKVTPHCMRHTFITRCDELNINETASMSWTGHKTNKMHRRYKHKTTKIMVEATETLMASSQRGDNLNTDELQKKIEEDKFLKELLAKYPIEIVDKLLIQYDSIESLRDTLYENNRLKSQNSTAISTAVCRQDTKKEGI